MRNQCLGRLLFVLAAWVAPLGAQRWQMQYFYDQNRSAFVIQDLQFPSQARGVAAGVIVKEKSGHQQPMSAVSSDGGAHWQLVPLEEAPVSLYFLNENAGWMVTVKGLWRTSEAGRSWHKLPHIPSGIVRVHFADESTGWAIGEKGAVLQTIDAAQHWTPVAAPPQTPARKSAVHPDVAFAYDTIAFNGKDLGLITGWDPSALMTRSRLPDWIDPRAALGHSSWPHPSYQMITRDGGKTWQHAMGESLGHITRIRFGAKGPGWVVIEYPEGARYPAAVRQIDRGAFPTSTTYSNASFAISDAWPSDDGTVYLAGTTVAGRVRSLIPQKVQVRQSKDYVSWTPIEVDYRATAKRTILAGAGSRDLWLATDTGMILKLVP